MARKRHVKLLAQQKKPLVRLKLLLQKQQKAPVKHRRHFGKCAALLRKPATTPAVISTTAAVSAGNRVFKSRHTAAYIEF